MEFLNIIIFLSLFAVGFIVGTWNEKRHYRSIEKREQEFLHLPAVTFKNASYDAGQVAEAKLVGGNAVISVDYFKRILAGLRNIFGGTIKSYESLIDRARREAILRMKEEAQGASIILNVRVETASIGRNAHKKGVASVEAFAYGTAVIMKNA